MDSNLYETILEVLVHRLVKDVLTTKNTCGVLQEGIMKELDLARDKVFSKYGEGLDQSTAFLITLDSYRTIELAKFCLVLSMTESKSVTQNLKIVELSEEVLVIDGAEKMAQILQQGFNEEASQYIARKLNVKSDIFKSLVDTFKEEKET